MKALILAGGQGTRFWPASRKDRPKQFLKLGSEKRSLLQLTYDRLQPVVSEADVYVACSSRYVEQVARQLPGLQDSQIIVEAAPRNTAPCVGLAAQRLLEAQGDDVLAILPADHLIGDGDEFRRLLQKAGTLADREEALVTFGIQPEYPATGYGYIRKGRQLEDQAFRVRAFVEKPNRERAREYLESGDYLWNSGMFVWKLSVIRDQIRRLLPELDAALNVMSEAGWETPAAARAFEAVSAVSIDYGVMEKAENTIVIPCRMEWSDVGSWQALLDPSLAAGGEDFRRLEIDSEDCVVQAPDGKLVVLVGVRGMVVVDTGDVLLVCPAKDAERVREAVDRLGKEGLDEYL